MTFATVVAPIMVATLLTNAQYSQRATPRAAAAVITKKIENCVGSPDPPTNIRGTIKLFLPLDLNLDGPKERHVKKISAVYDQNNSLDPNKNVDGLDNTWNLGTGELDRIPFDIGVKSTISSATDGYIAIHIIKKARSSYSFYNKEKFIVLSDNIDPETFCGLHKISNGKRDVAVFYIDIKRFLLESDERSISIGVQSSAMDDTPIFIDPKVRNEG